jgi:tripartite-type tricarboxylate transporter receptor subunit TctC
VKLSMGVRCVVGWFLAISMTARLPVHAEIYPSKPVKIILQAAAGSGPDVIGRIVAERLGQAWGQQVQIINRVGAGGLLAAEAAVSAAPDGYNLFQATTGSLLVLPATKKLPFDLGRDLAPIGMLGEQPYFIAAAPSLGVNTLPELIALAKKRPGEVLYVAASRGSMPHLTAELFRTKAAVDLTFVPYPNIPQSLQDVMTGRIPMIVESLPGLSSVVETGAVKLLAVTTPKRLYNFPNVPAVAEILPGFTSTGWFALMGPANTPDTIVQKVSRDLRAVLSQSDVQQRFVKLGTYIRPMSPTETAEFIRDEQNHWWPIVKQTQSFTMT